MDPCAPQRKFSQAICAIDSGPNWKTWGAHLASDRMIDISRAPIMLVRRRRNTVSGWTITSFRPLRPPA